MEVLFVALPVALLLGAAAVTAFIIAARQGQFDDLETPPQRMLYDDLEVQPVDPITDRADGADRESESSTAEAGNLATGAPSPPPREPNAQ